MPPPYALPDDIQETRGREWVTAPLWPLLAAMTGGALLSWPWFLFNGWALGSATRRRELGLVAGGVVGSEVLLGASIVVMVALDLGPTAGDYFMVLITAWKLWISYSLYELQSRAFEQFTWYGGTARNGAAVAFLVGGFVKLSVLPELPHLVALVLE